VEDREREGFCLCTTDARGWSSEVTLFERACGGSERKKTARLRGVSEKQARPAALQTKNKARRGASEKTARLRRFRQTEKPAAPADRFRKTDACGGASGRKKNRGRAGGRTSDKKQGRGLRASEHRRGLRRFRKTRTDCGASAKQRACGAAFQKNRRACRRSR